MEQKDVKLTSPQVYTILERRSAINGSGKTGQLHVKKNETRSFFNSIHKNMLKMDSRPKCETEHYKIPGGKHRQNTLT